MFFKRSKLPNTVVSVGWRLLLQKGWSQDETDKNLPGMPGMPLWRHWDKWIKQQEGDGCLATAVSKYTEKGWLRGWVRSQEPNHQ